MSTRRRADLIKACTKGEHIGKGTLVVRKAGGDDAARIHQDRRWRHPCHQRSTGGSDGEDRLTENVTLNFAEVQVRLQAADREGRCGRYAGFSWDIAANKEA